MATLTTHFANNIEQIHLWLSMVCRLSINNYSSWSGYLKLALIVIAYLFISPCQYSTESPINIDEYDAWEALAFNREQLNEIVTVSVNDYHMAYPNNNRVCVGEK